MTIPPVVAIAVPITMPIARALSENVFLPVTTQIVLSIPQIVCVPRIVSISEIVCVPQIVSILELRSGVSLVPHACDSWISAIGEWRDSIALRDSCHGVWTRARERTSTQIKGRPVRGRW